MRPRGALIIAIVALALTACARQPTRYAYVAPPQPGLDGMIYGQGGPYYPVAQRQPVYAAPAAPRQSYAATAPVAAGPAYAVAAVTGEAPYRLDSGDRVRVTVFGQEGLNNSYVIDPSGLITLPLAGAVQARGLTKDQLAAAIAGKLRQGYIRDPNVAVEIETYRPFFILGEVNAPGQYPYVANLTIENAVAIAGGYSPRADKRRVTVTRMINGQTFRGPMSPTTALQPGDTVQIEERWF